MEPGQEKSVFYSTKLNGAGDLKWVLTSDMEMQSLEFAQLVVFYYAFVQYFLAMPLPLFLNGNVSPVSSLCWKYVIFLLIFTGDYS